MTSPRMLSIRRMHAQREARAAVHSNTRSQGCWVPAELGAAVAGLPGALTSVVPELMVDYLATVFVEQDAQPVAR